MTVMKRRPQVEEGEQVEGNVEEVGTWGMFLRPQHSVSLFEWYRVYLSVFLKRRAAARYRALASIIPGRERFS